MAAGVERTVQQDYSRGMFRSVAPEMIPPSGCYDITNGLLDENGAVYRRGGASVLSTLGTEATFIWSGFLGGEHTTVAGGPGGMALIAHDGTETPIVGLAGLDAPARATVMDGVMYLPGGATYDGTTVATAPKVAPYYAVAANRLLAADGDRVYESDIVAVAGDPVVFPATQYILLPGGVEINGIAGLRDSAAVFTSDGVWVIGNLGYNLTDSDGNSQQRLDRYSSDLILWGEAGIAAWSGGLVVPALDAVWIIQLGVVSEAVQQFTRVSGAIADLYRDYVSRGYKPGLGCVYRGHYLLPILDGANPVDLLVCRLDATDRNGRPTFPWTHCNGRSAEVRGLSHTSEEIPRLLAVAHTNVLRARYFDPSGSAAFEDDGSIAAWEMTTRDYATGSLNLNTILKLRGTYEMQAVAGSEPVIQAFFGSDRETGTEWGLFDWGEADWTAAGEGAAGVALEGFIATDAPVDQQAALPFSWAVRKKVRYGRFRLRCEEATSRLSWRSLEVFVRAAGRL